MWLFCGKCSSAEKGQLQYNVQRTKKWCATICWFYRWAVLISTLVGCFLYGGLLKRNYTEPRYASPLLINQCKLERFWTTGGGFVHIWWKGISNLSTSHASHVFQLDWLEKTTHQPTNPPTHPPAHPPTHQPTNQHCQPSKLLASRSFYILGVAIIFEITKAWPPYRLVVLVALKSALKVTPFGRFSLSWFCGL